MLYTHVYHCSIIVVDALPQSTITPTAESSDDTLELVGLIQFETIGVAAKFATLSSIELAALKIIQSILASRRGTKNLFRGSPSFLRVNTEEESARPDADEDHVLLRITRTMNFISESTLWIVHRLLHYADHIKFRFLRPNDLYQRKNNHNDRPFSDKDHSVYQSCFSSVRIFKYLVHI